MIKLLGPTVSPTGGTGSTPKSEDTRHEWYFDANGFYQHADFLDAPNAVPCGSVRVSSEWDTADGKHYALLTHYTWREGVHA